MHQNPVFVWLSRLFTGQLTGKGGGGPGMAVGGAQDRLSRVLPGLLPVFIVLVGFLLMVFDPAPVQGLRNGMFDQYQRWQPRVYEEAPVRIIDIDEESLKRLGQWPWPRTRLADLVGIARNAQAAAIGFDVVFAEADRTSPQVLASQLREGGNVGGGGGGGGGLQAAPSEPQATALQALLQSRPDHDVVFKDALSGGGTVLGFTMGPKRDAAPGESPVLARPAPYVQVGPSALQHLYRYDSALPSLLPFQKAAAGNGVLTFVQDPDGVLRRVPLVLRFKDDPVPSLTAELLRVGQGAKNTILISAQTMTGTSAGLQEVRIGDVSVPTTAEGEAWVHYTGPQATRYIPAWKVLSKQIPPEQLKGKLLLVGSSAQGLMDLRVSPLGKIIPGVEVHAQALEQMLTGKLMTRPSWAIAVEILGMLVVGCAVGWLTLNARALQAALVSTLAIFSVFSISWLAFAQYHVLLNPLTPSLIVLVSFMLCSLVHHFRSERQQRWLTDAFSRYVSPNKVAYLMSHPEGLELGGARQTCSFIFTDLQGFTTLMESMDPGAAVSSLNAYLDGMIAIAFKHEGTLDRIMGDAVAVVFSAPVPQDDHRQRALDCALEMHAFSKRYAINQQANGVPFGNTRIGVHAGEVIVGNFGGSTMFDYRALGDPVNTAARLESVNKHLGTLVCISAAIVAGCPDVVARPVGRLVLKGKKQALMVYEPVVEGDALTRTPLADYTAAYAVLAAQGNTDEAMAVFHDLAQKYTQDPLVRLHWGRLQRGEQGDEIVMAEK